MDIMPSQLSKSQSSSPYIKQTRLTTSSKMGLMDQMQDSASGLVLSFSGQGGDYLEELASLYQESPLAKDLIEAAASTIHQTLSSKEMVWSGFYTQGSDLLSWITDKASQPDTLYLSSSMISQALIFLTQVSRFVVSWERGLNELFVRQKIVASIGHSQGIMAALLVAEDASGRVQKKRLCDYIEYFLWQGYYMQVSYQKILAGQSIGQAFITNKSPMVAVSVPAIK